ncbi:uncharacterized protein PFL1_01018 [Pseudozyma flocculosa PF-1]|uniref:Uncharacterized protein n=1 Tax=Pseudozyma flocculosa TaxID=84751 RepID=A0A5C3F8S5_9BASI|nr:uncharacterized protein PFL1_01018 [Pseudozyma flocculosa PF-1]EPQ31685.1 hypothetical protein PFL1_01018 [Pseudozyma flocculosa PF-1]SPO40802.1 uncharacterized protein PSFLO_06284 [Pseudozyma flocculosa]
MKNVLARSALRVASGSTRTLARSAVTPALFRSNGLAPHGSSAEAFRGDKLAAPRAFSTSPTACKKKGKSSSAVEEVTEFDDDDSAAFEDDDLFGGTTSEHVGPDDAAAPPSSDPAGPRQPAGPTWNQAFAFVESHLAWDKLDLSREPSVRRWRYLARHANTKDELLSALSLAETYLDRVGKLGVESGPIFGRRAAAIGYPEVGLHAFLERYRFGMEADLPTLYLIQRELRAKAISGSTEALLESVTLEGAPVQEVDLLAPVAPEADDAAAAPAADAEAAAPAETAEQTDADADAAVRAQLSILDRMALAVILTPHFNYGFVDPIILSFLPATYINVFGLQEASNRSRPDRGRVVEKVDSTISLLVSAMDTALPDKNARRPKPFRMPSHFYAGTTSQSREQGLKTVRANLHDILAYLGSRRQQVDARGLEPVRVIERYMKKLDKQSAKMILDEVKPKVQQSVRQ